MSRRVSKRRSGEVGRRLPPDAPRRQTTRLDGGSAGGAARCCWVTRSRRAARQSRSRRRCSRSPLLLWRRGGRLPGGATDAQQWVRPSPPSWSRPSCSAVSCSRSCWRRHASWGSRRSGSDALSGGRPGAHAAAHARRDGGPRQVSCPVSPIEITEGSGGCWGSLEHRHSPVLRVMRPSFRSVPAADQMPLSGFSAHGPHTLRAADRTRPSGSAARPHLCLQAAPTHVSLQGQDALATRPWAPHSTMPFPDGSMSSLC